MSLFVYFLHHHPYVYMCLQFHLKLFLILFNTTKQYDEAPSCEQISNLIPSYMLRGVPHTYIIHYLITAKVNCNWGCSMCMCGPTLLVESTASIIIYTRSWLNTFKIQSQMIFSGYMYVSMLSITTSILFFLTVLFQ